MSEALIILGNQLFDLKKVKALGVKSVFMCEDNGLCTHYKYHKHKIILFLSAMRSYRDELIQAGYDVTYITLEKNRSGFIDELKSFLSIKEINTIHFWEIEDKFFEKIINSIKIHKKEHLSPMFLTSRKEFKVYLMSTKKPFMKTFYENSRIKHNVLINDENPVGGKFSFDSENRNKLPRDFKTPPSLMESPTQHTIEVSTLVDTVFSTHPGSINYFSWATTRERALEQLDFFLEYKLQNFGTYQDSISNKDPFLYHSLISPYINMGLLTPIEVVRKIEKKYHSQNIPLNSIEGFIRQVLGWREFVRGIYQNYSEEQEKRNFFNHSRCLPKKWVEAKTGFIFLDDAIKKAYKYGYNHHIERLMIMGNMMVLLEIHPQDCYKWFMEMYIDSSDWVMGPNVYGMGIFSDGGIFATKPYICSSNYYLKMGDYKKGPWCDDMNALYWGFIYKHQTYFKSQYRLSMMVAMWNKKSKTDQKNLLKKREEVLEKIHQA